MDVLLLVFIFTLGAAIASFMGVVSGRLSSGQSIVSGRSRCDACNSELSASSLVPIFSYVFLRGKAQCCGASLSPLMAVSEILLGVLFAAAYLTLGFTLALPFLLVSFSLLLTLVLYDLAHQILPPPLLIPFVASSAFAGFFMYPNDFLAIALTAALIALSLALMHVLSKGMAMGFADAPFALGCAFLAGPSALSGFVFSFWIGAAIGIIILLRRPSGSRIGVEVPFAPFLAAGFLLAHFTQWNLFAFTAAFL
jgi:prepilin signal peptidase PulO-like enzyme (type II secretory pathway)